MLCRVLFELAVHALPFFVAVSIGLSILNAGLELRSAVLVGLVAGMLTAAVDRIAFTAVPSVIVRLMVMIMFVIPTAIAGYHGAHGLAWFAAPSTSWRGVLAWVGAVSCALLRGGSLLASMIPAPHEPGLSHRRAPCDHRVRRSPT